MAAKKKTPAIKMFGSIMFEGASDGDVYFVRQDDETGEIYVTSNMGINTIGSNCYKNLSEAVKHCTQKASE